MIDVKQAIMQLTNTATNVNLELVAPSAISIQTTKHDISGNTLLRVPLTVLIWRVFSLTVTFTFSVLLPASMSQSLESID